MPRSRNWLLQKRKRFDITNISEKDFKYVLGLHFFHCIPYTKATSMEPKQIYFPKTKEDFDSHAFFIPKF